MNATDFTAEQILAIPLDQPERLYSQENCELEWKKLRSLWHTDKHSVDGSVFQHAKALFEAAKEKLGTGTWHIPGEIHFTELGTGKEYAIKYKKHHAFELGDMYIGETIVAYAITDDNADLYEHGIKMIRSLKFPDDKIKKEASRFVPKILKEFRTINHRVVVLEKDPDLLLLRDVLEYYKCQLDEKHVAWVVSRLCNLSCYLGMVMSIAHGDISPDTYFIGPSDHVGCLMGGWWYAQSLDKKLLSLPARTMSLGIVDLADPRATTELTGELIRSLGREALGDIHGSKLLMNKDLKKPMTTWLRTASNKSPLKEYQEWTSVLESSFGKRKFVELKLTSTDLYTD